MVGISSNIAASIDELEIDSPDGKNTYVTLLGCNGLPIEERLEVAQRLKNISLFLLVGESYSAHSIADGSEPIWFCQHQELGQTLIDQLFFIAHQTKTIKQLQHESHCYREMVDSCPDYVFIRDRESRIVFSNSALAKLHNLSQLEMTGKTYTELTGDTEAGKHVVIQDGDILSSGRPFYQHEDFYHDENESIQWNRVSKKE